MAEILLARAIGIEGFHKLLVVKRVLPQLLAERSMVEMFLNEARLAATLQHQNIVQVYDIGATDGQYYLTMEFLEGADLSKVLRASTELGMKIPLEHVLLIMISVLAGLHYAHEKRDAEGRWLRIVHRDVSPHNVIVTYEGMTKLVDFGIAKASQSISTTRTGAIRGKVPYMSPEQCRSEALDQRSDIYSAAILLWELSVHRRLFESESELEIMNRIAYRDAPKPSDFVPGYPRELEAIVMKGLARERDARFPTAAEFQVALEGFAHQRSPFPSSRGLSQFMGTLFPASERPSFNIDSEEAVAPDRGATTVLRRSRTPKGRQISIGVRTSKAQESPRVVRAVWVLALTAAALGGAWRVMRSPISVGAAPSAAPASSVAPEVAARSAVVPTPSTLAPSPAPAPFPITSASTGVDAPSVPKLPLAPRERRLAAKSKSGGATGSRGTHARQPAQTKSAGSAAPNPTGPDHRLDEPLLPP